jgi:ribosome-associated heat shock protein Hsp15
MVRLNRNRVAKCSQTVKPDDVITLTLHDRVRVIKVRGEAARRGPPAASTNLYEELTIA